MASRPTPRSLAIASKGVKTSHEFAQLMSGLMCDLIEGTITPSVGNATCNAGGKLLRVVELQVKYGFGEGKNRVLRLTAGEEAGPSA